jgi:ATP-dependent RNA helicase DDX23/PRP28
MSSIKFVSRKERDRLQQEEERQIAEERKKVEQENKLRKREFLKQALTSATVVDSQKQPEPLVRRSHNHEFDYDLEAEDTGVTETVLDNPAVNEGEDKSLKKLDEKLSTSTSLIHWKQKLTSEMTQRDWRIFREDHEIYVSGGREIPNPFRSWSESGLPRGLLDAIHRAGYTKPTPIQMQAIPIAMVPRDIVGISSTGSGKTAAFVLPMLYYIQQRPRITSALAADGPYALIMAPSRELALQIEQEAHKFSAFCSIRVSSIVGGRSAEQQTLTLSQGVELIVATPGRLADSLDAKQTVLNQCFYVVLDEADKMVDMNMEPFLNRILDSIPSNQERITQMFSATMPPSVERLTRKYLVNPVTVTVGGEGGSAKTEIQQRLEFVQTENEKRKKLYEVISETESPIIIFVNSKRSADQVGNQLDNAGHRTMVLHSGKMQQKREDAIAQFKSGSAEVLVATDVAGRGIDVPDVKHVINYDMARTIEDYTHRIGRTGRGAGKSGLATSFILPYDQEILPELKKFFQSAKQYIPPELSERASMDVDHEASSAKRRREATVFVV